MRRLLSVEVPEIACDHCGRYGTHKTVSIVVGVVRDDQQRARRVNWIY
jgi:hypothetical protein